MSVDNVADISPINQYVATNGQTAFDYDFPIFEDSDVVVYVGDDLQALTTDYAVTGEGEDTGGVVTFVTGLAAGDVVTIYRDVPIERTTDFQQNGPRRSADMNDELDRMTMWMQQLERNIGRAVRLSLRNSQVSSDLELDSAFDGRYLYVNDDGEIEPAAEIATTTLTQSILSALMSPRTTAEQASAVTPTDYRYDGDDVRGEINIKRYGAGSSQSNAQNKAHLQTAISVADEVLGNGQSNTGSCIIIVPHDCEYGYVATTRATHPDFDGVTHDMLVIDYTPGSTYAPTGRDGMQVRYFFHTPQTTPVGQHDGNGQWIRADWHPYLVVSNDGGPQSPRTAADNRRASVFFARDGVLSWRIGQSTQESSTASDDELSNLGVAVFDGPLAAGGAVFLAHWSFTTGNYICNTDSNAESANYHFKARSSGYINCIVESLTQTAQIHLRNSDGSGDDIVLRNNNGAFEVSTSAGVAMAIDQTDRRVGLGTSGTPAFRLDVLDTRSSNFTARIRNASATNGSVLTFDSASVPGTGFSYLDCVSDYDGTPDTEFRLRGDGTGLCDGSWTGGGADYAEYFEWVDGNAQGEDRRGVSVALVDGKIRPALAGEDPIGVVSARPTVVGDAAALRWQGKYIMDEFGDYVLDDNGRRQLSQDFNDATPYVPREQRKEWACIGLMGKLRTRNGQVIGSRWIKLRDISESVSEWLVR